MINHNESIESLKKSPFFKHLSDGDIEMVLENKHCRIIDYKKGTVIYIQNQLCETLDIILEGNIVVQKIDISGKSLSVIEVSSGEVLGINLIYADNNCYPATVTTKSHSKVLHIKKEYINILCHTDPTFLNSFLKTMSNRTLHLENIIKILFGRTMRQRITDFLTSEYKKQKTTALTINMTITELSQKLGVERPSLSKELSKMQKEGLLEYKKTTFIIKQNFLDIDLI